VGSPAANRRPLGPGEVPDDDRANDQRERREVVSGEGTGEPDTDGRGRSARAAGEQQERSAPERGQPPGQHGMSHQASRRDLDPGEPFGLLGRGPGRGDEAQWVPMIKM
jgi:hypothetical protein